MLWEIIHMGVYEEVGIYQNHLNASPSATAMTSEMSSRLANWQRPKLTERVSYGFPRRRGLVISLRPCRKASLITTFKLVLRDLRTLSKSLATSSSSVSVVLMHQYIIHLMRLCQYHVWQIFLNIQKLPIKLWPILYPIFHVLIAGCGVRKSEYFIQLDLSIAKIENGWNHCRSNKVGLRVLWPRRQDERRTLNWRQFRGE